MTTANEMHAAIAQAYAPVRRSTRILEIRDHGRFAPNLSAAQMREGVARQVHEAQHCALGSSDRGMQQFLFDAARRHQSKVAIEFGTCFGVSAAALAFAMGGGQLVTIEADSTLASIAREQLAALGLEWVDVKRGLFNDVLAELELEQIDLVFDDGDHTGDGELQRFAWVREHCAERVCCIWDDIRWSKEMFDWWRYISTRPEASEVRDRGRAGSLVWTR